MKGLPRERVQSYYDFPNPFHIKGMRSILWPCTVFAVSISQQKSDRLNIFEKTVLRLLSLGIKGQELAETLCISIDFLRFWLARLEQAQYLAGNNITNTARDFLAARGEVAYKNILLYREESGGKILPFCTSIAPQYLQGDDKGLFFCNPADPIRIHSPITVLPGPSRNAPPPAPKQILNALCDFDAFRSLTPFIGSEKDRDQTEISKNCSVKVISGEGQFTFLYCFCALAPNGRDVLVYSPFGYRMVERELSSSLKNAREFDEISEALHSQENDIASERTEQDESRNAFAGMVDEINILAPLSEAAEALGNFSGGSHVVNKALQRQKRRALSKFASNICIVLESVLGFILKHRSENDVFAQQLRSIVDVAINDDSASNAVRLRRSAEETGFRQSGEGRQFLSLSPEDARNFRVGLINLRILFAVNLLAARQADSSHPFWSLAVNRPELIDAFGLINNINNSFGHGRECDAPDMEKLNDIFSGTLELLGLATSGYEQAIKQLRAKPGSPKGPDSKKESGSASRLNRFFPASLLTSLPAKIYELLWDAEAAFAEAGFAVDADENDPAYAHKDFSAKQLRALYAFCQSVLAELRKGFSSSCENWQKKSLDAACSAGFRLEKNQLPPALAATRKKFVENAFANGNSTLGAEAIAVLCSLPEEQLVEFAKESPGLLMSVERLVTLRDHGSGTISAENALAVRRDIYADILPLLYVLVR